MYISVLEQNDFYLICSAQITNTQRLPNTRTIKIEDSDLFVYILELLAEQKTITFYKYVDKITKECLNIGDGGNFKRAKYLQTLTAKMSEIFTTIPSYNYFRYQYLNNIFAANGIFITNENREEKYIEILEKDDEALTEKLEEFLKVTELLTNYEKLYQMYLNGISQIEITDDELKMKAIVDEALNFFNSAKKNFITLVNDEYFDSLKAKYMKSNNI